ncbi:probable LRR receptor-like serine/threonine-protein kinase At1g63430 isoform X1 [Spinacia oleracea]|uniref:Probable LRR receptor-like serine/threonine-protein kinase At1g63430 isoform X1 n=1 Tax=Spinacia oleracea TaxID=3562 RepID=A0ABM3QJ78_SPIOL|nr:probable LRR receptor-like serine/threonine-protein kinase At1g63430 isoform X1 [Spinacia oleracea]
MDVGAKQFSGSIPHEIGNLSSIKKMNLQSNVLTGMLPHELGNSKSLQELHLDRNKLQVNVIGLANANSESNMHGMFASNGNVIGLCSLPQLMVVDLSYNFFGGIVLKCLLHLPSANFHGNCLDEKSSKQRSDAQCGAAISAKGHPNPSANTKGKSRESETKHQKSRPTWLLALEIVTGTMVGTLLITALITTYKRFNNKSSMIIPWKKSGSDKERLAVYIVACEDFNNIEGGSEIAVISFCIKEEQWTGYHELYFQREVADLARLNHENAGKLLGYCRESPPFTRMLVFEYACNGTLYEHLHFMFADGEGCQLSWTRRMKIIIGIARGLRDLHTELNPPFTISELNSSAVYLTEDFSPKVYTPRIAPYARNLMWFVSNGLSFLPTSIYYWL